MLTQEPNEDTLLARDSVRDALTYLTSVTGNNFYAQVLNSLDKYAVPGLGTMAVAIERGKYVFMYDPEYANNVTFKTLVASCEHEVLHIVLAHIPRYRRWQRLALLDQANDTMSTLSKLLYNVSMDMAVNERVRVTHPELVDEEGPMSSWILARRFKPPLQGNLSLEEYHSLLLAAVMSRLENPDNKLFAAAKQILKQIQEQLSTQGQQRTPGDSQAQCDKPEPGENDGAGEGSSEKSEPEHGSEGQASSGGDDQPQEQQNGHGNQRDYSPIPVPDNLDVADQAILKAIIRAAMTHPEALTDTIDTAEADAHGLEAYGRQVIKTAATQFRKSRGTIPGYMDELITQMLQPPVTPWTQLFYNLVQRTRQTKKFRGMSRPSKLLASMQRYIQIVQDKYEDVDETPDRMLALLRLAPVFRKLSVFPGTKRVNKFTIAYAVDTSGSMSQADMAAGLAQLQCIQKGDSDIDICVIYADTEITKEYWVTPTATLDYAMSGRGGTDFEAVFEFVAANLLTNTDKAVDLLVYCTDGYAPPPTTKLPIPTIWLLTPRGRVVTGDAGHVTLEMKDYQLGESEY